MQILIDAPASGAVSVAVVDESDMRLGARLRRAWTVLLGKPLLFSGPVTVRSETAAAAVEFLEEWLSRAEASVPAPRLVKVHVDADGREVAP